MNTPRSLLERRLARLQSIPGLAAVLAENRIGLEKEGLRVAPDGRIATTPHPRALGSALTHPWITTDFSEALLELITPPLVGAQAAVDWLSDLHRYVHRHLGDELLWATSMPCVIAGADSIPLAEYGTSNAAIMKTVYRRGLGNRYGRAMQVIAGVHFNFSFADAFWEHYQASEDAGEEARAFRDRAQMGMIRNLQRLGWLVPYLFGASPAICASFVHGQSTDLRAFDDETLYYPYATSLRMGDIGYQNQQEQGTGIKACYDSLDAYVRSLTWAIQTPCPQYETIGVKVGERYEQLNANVLQIENEYYSTVRPKQLTEWLERPTLALRRRGIRYVELRSPDVNVFAPAGVEVEQLRFLEVLMLHALLADSPVISSRERRDIDTNQVLTAHRGREPGLCLVRARRPVELRLWACELLDAMLGSAELLDGAADGPHSQAVRAQRAKVREPELTPSARVLATMRETGEGFFEFSRRLSLAHRATLLQEALDPAREAELDRQAAESVLAQQRLESETGESFDAFLARYFAQGET